MLSVNKALEQFLTSILVLYHLADIFTTQMDRYPFCWNELDQKSKHEFFFHYHLLTDWKSISLSLSLCPVLMSHKFCSGVKPCSGKVIWKFFEYWHEQEYCAVMSSVLCGGESISHYMALVTCFRSHHCLALHAQRDRTSVLRGSEGIGQWTVHSGGSQWDRYESTQDRSGVGQLLYFHCTNGKAISYIELCQCEH